VCEQRNGEAGGPGKTQQDTMETDQTLEDARKRLQKDIQSATENGNLGRALKVSKDTLPREPVVEQLTAGQQPKNFPSVTQPQPPSGQTQTAVEQQEVGPDGGQPQVEDEAFNEARLICKEKLYEAFEKGELTKVLKRVLNRSRPESQISQEDAPPAPPVPPAQPHPDRPGPPPRWSTPLAGPTPPAGPRVVQPLTPQGAPPPLPSAPLGTVSPEAVEQARIRLQDLLQTALQQGTLDTVVSQLLAREAGGQEVGAHGPIVSEPDGQRAKERIRQVLEKGLTDGNLDIVLGRLRGDANPQMNNSRERMVQVLETAAANGKLQAAMDPVFGTPGAQIEDTRKQLHSDLKSAIQTGGLHQALKVTGSNTGEATEAGSDQHKASDQASGDVQVAREMRKALEKASRDGQLEKKCREFLRPSSNDSTRDAPAIDPFESVQRSRQAEQVAQPDSRPPRPSAPAPTEPRPPVRRSHTQDIICVREQLERLKTENEGLRDKVEKMVKLMQEEEAKRRREATQWPPSA